MKTLFLAASLSCAAQLLPPAHAADAYPVRPIRFIVPFPPGGGADTLARTVGQKLGETWGQQVVIDNRPGGATNIAAELVANAVPDGYTLLETVLAHAVNASLYAKLGYDLQRDFAPVVFMATIPNILVVHPSVPVKSTREIVDKLNAETNRVLKNQELRERLAAEGAEFIGGTAEAYGTFIRSEMAKWAKVVKFAQIKAE